MGSVEIGLREGRSSCVDANSLGFDALIGYVNTMSHIIFERMRKHDVLYDVLMGCVNEY